LYNHHLRVFTGKFVTHIWLMLSSIDLFSMIDNNKGLCCA